MGGLNPRCSGKRDGEPHPRHSGRRGFFDPSWGGKFEWLPAGGGGDDVDKKCRDGLQVGGAVRGTPSIGGSRHLPGHTGFAPPPPETRVVLSPPSPISGHKFFHNTVRSLAGGEGERGGSFLLPAHSRRQPWKRKIYKNNNKSRRRLNVYRSQKGQSHTF